MTDCSENASNVRGPTSNSQLRSPLIPASTAKPVPGGEAAFEIRRWAFDSGSSCRAAPNHFNHLRVARSGMSGCLVNGSFGGHRLRPANRPRLPSGVTGGRLRPMARAALVVGRPRATTAKDAWRRNRLPRAWSRGTMTSDSHYATVERRPSCCGLVLSGSGAFVPTDGGT
jgi:hypothetical protein